MRRFKNPAVWIPMLIIVVLLAVFHDSPPVLAMWALVQALWRLLVALDRLPGRLFGFG